MGSRYVLHSLELVLELWPAAAAALEVPLVVRPLRRPLRVVCVVVFGGFWPRFWRSGRAVIGWARRVRRGRLVVVREVRCIVGGGFGWAGFLFGLGG